MKAFRGSWSKHSHGPKSQIFFNRISASIKHLVFLHIILPGSLVPISTPGWEETTWTIFLFIPERVKVKKQVCISTHQ